jgi:hypothetical protein
MKAIQYKCVNVNVVVNGVTIGPGSDDETSGLAASALRDGGPNGGHNGPSGFKSFDKDFVFVCINNNDNDFA